MLIFSFFFLYAAFWYRCLRCYCWYYADATITLLFSFFRWLLMLWLLIFAFLFRRQCFRQRHFRHCHASHDISSSLLRFAMPFSLSSCFSFLSLYFRFRYFRFSPLLTLLPFSFFRAISFFSSRTSPYFHYCCLLLLSCCHADIAYAYYRLRCFSLPCAFAAFHCFRFFITPLPCHAMPLTHYYCWFYVCWLFSLRLAPLICWLLPLAAALPLFFDTESTLYYTEYRQCFRAMMPLFSAAITIDATPLAAIRFDSFRHCFLHFRHSLMIFSSFAYIDAYYYHAAFVAEANTHRIHAMPWGHFRYNTTGIDIGHTMLLPLTAEEMPLLLRRWYLLPLRQRYFAAILMLSLMIAAAYACHVFDAAAADYGLIDFFSRRCRALWFSMADAAYHCCFSPWLRAFFAICLLLLFDFAASCRASLPPPWFYYAILPQYYFSSATAAPVYAMIYTGEIRHVLKCHH